MRRKDREITDRELQRSIIENCDAIRIAFAVADEPYLVAMNFGFTWNDHLQFYLHSAREGKKIDMMRLNGRVCFQMDTNHRLVTGELSCRWGMKYAGIVGRGTLAEVTDETERRYGLERLMLNYGKKGPNRFAAEMLQQTLVLRLDVTEISCKRRVE
jgi:nitroimidazol reductase NimA-like FMN-containing flavoprotein (pyridoxamine 5'-phosphate oxidase superfamily)